MVIKVSVSILRVSNSVIEELIAVFPTSLYMLRQFLKIDRDDFTKYVVCPKCYNSPLGSENHMHFWV